MSPEEMDALLLKAFLQAVKGLKEKELPVETSLFYAQYMRPARPKGSILDIKKSSHKKLATFLGFLCSEGIIRVASSKGQTKLTEVKRNHPLLKEFTPLPFEETAGGEKALEEEAAASAKTPAPIEIEERFRPHHSMYGTLFPDDRQAYYSAQECRTVLSEYIEKEGLVDPMKEGSIVLDPHLCDALFQGESHDGPLPTHLQRHEVVKRFAARLNAFFLMQGGSMKKGNIVPAKYVTGPGGQKTPMVPGVSIKTENRRGHNCTILRGLEILGVDPESFAEEMKVAFAASTSVESQTNSVGKKTFEVMMQGYWDKTLAQHLHQVYKLPKVCIEVHAKKGQSEKNPKSASNICRS